ncbi:MAG: hypothetical protein QXR22_06325, partial [Acidilobaceae archaeon]
VCEDYRATVTVDFAMDSADHGHRRIACPVLVIWGSDSHCGRHFRPLEAWSEWAPDLRGFGVPTGHYPAEQRPDLIERYHIPLDEYPARCEAYSKPLTETEHLSSI